MTVLLRGALLALSSLIDQIFKNVQGTDGVALFADDGAMWKKGRNLGFIVKKMQSAVNEVQQWTVQWGFRISVEKTKVMFFSRGNISPEFKIYLSGCELERVEAFKYLGVWFDKKLTWAFHIQKMLDKCKKVLNVMRCLCGAEWGASVAALRTIYTGLMRSVFDYGCVAYGSASKSLLQKLDVMHNQALRICCGAVKTSPVAAIQTEVGEMPLYLRREQLALVYWANLKGHSDSHIAQPVLRNCQERLHEGGRSFGWTIKQKAVNMGLSNLNICPTVSYPTVPPWTFEEARVDLGLLEEKQECEVGKWRVSGYLAEYYSQSLIIFTDASKATDRRVGVAHVVLELGLAVSKRLNDDLAVYTAELVAILFALLWIESNGSSNRHIVIASDSSSALISIQNSHSGSRRDITTSKWAIKIRF